MDDTNYTESGLPNELNIDNFSSINNTAADSSTYLEDQNSPINMSDNFTKNVGEVAMNPINLDKAQKSDSTNLTNSDASVTSNNGELSQDLILSDTNKLPSININLEPSQLDVFKPILNNDNPTINNTTSNISNSTSSTQFEGSTQYSNVEMSAAQPAASVVNESKPDKEKSKFLSKLGKVADSASKVLNLPSFNKTLDSANGFFGATGENIKSRASEISKSFSNNSINSTSNKNESKFESNNSTNTSTSEKVGTSSNSSEVTSVSQANMQIEQSKPTVSNISESKSETQKNNTTVNTSPTILNTQNPTTSSNTTSNTTSNTSQTIQPAKIENSPQPVTVNVDINQLAQSITRLERILLSGIEVTLKDT